MARLRSQGFQAFLVGGAVRDLLMGGHPKDFDVATDATPEEVHGLFRNSRVIGRRFRIVHVRFGREIIEVTTFRGHHDSEEKDDEPNSKPQAKQSDSGMLLRDNVFGSLEDDAVRRDFTVNALYYCSSDFCVYDYVDGLRDLEHEQIRIIGDAEQRYREDPVRMLRAVRFAAKLGFGIEPGTAEPIPELGYMLEAIPAARLFDEMLKLFMSGNALPTFSLLREYELLEHLFPATASELEMSDIALGLIEAAMESTDTRIAEDKPVTPAFVLAALLWPPVIELRKDLEDNGMSPQDALQEAGQSLISEQLHHIAIPRRFTAPMREIWEFQPRLQGRRGKKALELLGHRRFRAAYDFMLLREQAGEDLDGLGKYWTELQAKHPEAMTNKYPGDDGSERPPGDRPPRRRRRRRKRAQ
jgi:poly(A) polymerase